MTSQFSEPMSKLTDSELADILAVKREDYQPEAVIAAEIEFNNRGLNLSEYYTNEEIEEINRSKNLLKKIDIAEKESKKSDLIIGFFLLAVSFVGYIIAGKSLGVLCCFLIALYRIKRGIRD